MKKMLIILIMFFFVGGMATAFTPSEVLQQWEENYGFIRNFEIEYNIENIKLPKEAIPITHIKHSYDNGKFFRESIGLLPSRVIDGEEVPEKLLHYRKSFNGVDFVQHMPLFNKVTIMEA